ILVYGALLLGIFTAWAIAISQRSPLIVDVLRDRNALYRVVDTRVENAYALKISNKDVEARPFRIELLDAPGIELVGAPVEREIPAEATLNLPLALRAGTGLGRPRTEVVLRVVRTDDESIAVEHTTAFFAPP